MDKSKKVAREGNYSCLRLVVVKMENGEEIGILTHLRFYPIFDLLYKQKQQK